MRIRSAVAAAISFVGIAVAVHAQERPNFSGTWTAVAESMGPGTNGKPLPPVWGPEVTIAHTGQELTVNRTFAAGPALIKHVLDGSETKSRMPGRLCEPDSGATWTAAWDAANALAVTMTGLVPPNGKTIKTDVKAMLRLESADTLRVEVAARTGAQTAPRITSTVYRRSSEPATPAASSSNAKPQATIAQVSWIPGVWTGSGGTTTFEERWTPAAGGSMIGVSRTLRDGVMSAFEFLCIVERDGGLVYQAMPNGRSPATDFTMTKIDAGSVIFENPAHDFPKMIRYAKRADGALEATVSGAGGEKAQTFVFRRQE
ncbi:MAG TPA: DUF6265 family protein [Vicinamibacterales bacterium]|nr:DUF6265 family protein [Vicinamibacterales bacterium]